jgi:hypothetical protein
MNERPTTKQKKERKKERRRKWRHQKGGVEQLLVG